MRVGLAFLAVAFALLFAQGSTARTSFQAAATLYVDVHGSDSGKCTKTAPCATFQRAYAVASPGDTVLVASGRYPTETILAVQGKPTAARRAVTFQAVGRVDLNELDLGDEYTHPDAPSNLAFVGFHGSSAWNTLPGAANITFDHVQTTNLYDSGTQGYTVINSDFGDCTVVHVNGPCDNFKVEQGASNVLIANNVFHDFRVAPGSPEHFECMFLAGSTNTVLRNNVFRNCDYFDVFVQHFDNPFNGLRIENNWFDAAFDGHDHRTTAALWFSGRGYSWSDVAITRNSFDNASIHIDDTPSVSDFRVERNLIGPVDCFPGVTYTENYWLGGKVCSSTDLRQLPYGYSSQDGRLVLDKADAKALRRIFYSCAAGQRPQQVVKLLRADTSTRSLRPWTASVVRALASSEAYLGGTLGSKGSAPAVTWPTQFKKAQRLCRA